MPLMMTAHVSCGRAFQAFLAILEPERQEWEDFGVSQVTGDLGHQTKGLILDERSISSFGSKSPYHGITRARLVNSERVVAKAVSVSIALDLLPFCYFFFSAQSLNRSLPGEPTTWPTAEPF
jgi:hypothetical protein